MKTVIGMVLVLLAIGGILSQNGHATLISWLSVTPLVIFGLVMVFKALGGKSNTVNSIGLLLIGLPAWKWALLVLLAVALAVVVAYGLYRAIRALYSAWPG